MFHRGQQRLSTLIGCPNLFPQSRFFVSNFGHPIQTILSTFFCTPPRCSVELRLPPSHLIPSASFYRIIRIARDVSNVVVS